MADLLDELCTLSVEGDILRVDCGYKDATPVGTTITLGTVSCPSLALTLGAPGVDDLVSVAWSPLSSACNEITTSTNALAQTIPTIPTPTPIAPTVLRGTAHFGPAPRLGQTSTPVDVTSIALTATFSSPLATPGTMMMSPPQSTIKPSIEPMPPLPSSPNPTLTERHNGLRKASIVGISIAVLVMVMLVLSCAWYLWRRRTRHMPCVDVQPLNFGL
ncbi:hypothetical protein C8Q74DRAFT_982181 [Fomes fomentarius]|nr:hypothetical protein C8Q74DRAFT_982181 [Fomes fomentarius]